MTPEERIKELIGSIGVVSEFMFIYFNGLRNAGFTEEQALSLTDNFFRNMVEEGRKEK